MMFRLFKRVWLVGVILFFILFCSKQKQPDIAARIGERVVTLAEFRDMYQFNPALVGIKNEITAKKMLLNSLIAEKLLARAAVENGLNKEAMIPLYMQQFRREALIEKFWQDSIFTKVNLNEDELLQAYRQSKQKRVIQYLIYEDEKNASNDFERLETGLSFLNLAKLRGYTERTIPMDTIELKTPLPHIRNIVFEMKINDIHPPVKEGNYYFIIKLTDILTNIFQTKDDFEAMKPHLSKIIKKRQSAALFRKYIKTHFPEAPYSVDTDLLKKVVRQLDAQLFASKSPPDKQTSFSFDLAPETSLGQLASRPVVRFGDKKVWDVKKLLQRIQVSPYPIELDTPARFRLSILAAVKHIVDDEIIADEAEKAGLGESDYVQVQQQMWGDFLLFKLEKVRLLKGKKTSEQRKAAVDSVLQIMMDKTPIKINHAIIDTLSIPRTDMFVFKTHFPQRTIVPALEIIALPGNLKQ